MRRLICPLHILLSIIVISGFMSVTPCCSETHEKPRVRQFRVQRLRDDIIVSAVLKPAFTQDIEERIHAGTPTTFEFYLYLKKVRWYWDNKVLAHAVYRHTVTYDTLRKTYHIVIQREGVDQVILEKETKNSDEMRKLMITFKGTLHYPYSKLSHDTQYYVSITASMTTRQIPPPWNIFLSSDFKTQTNRKYFP